jgi:multidrug efflux pump subunit AcrA (membrane-fusion protein)
VTCFIVQVLEGLKPGEKVVTEGSFFLRAEATRMRSGDSAAQRT